MVSKPDHHGSLIADRVHDLRPRHREQEIGRKESELHQHDPRITQVKDRLQMWNQNVVQARQKSPHEEQRGDDRQRACVIWGRRSAELCAGRTSRNISSCHISSLSNPQWLPPRFGLHSVRQAIRSSSDKALRPQSRGVRRTSLHKSGRCAVPAG